MTGLRFLAALAVLPLIGRPFLPFVGLASLSRAARWGMAGVLGAVVLCVEMVAASWVHVRWTVWLLLLPSLIAALVPRRPATPRVPRGSENEKEKPQASVVWTVLAIVGAVAYAAATARATAADYILFWGPKGQRFGLAGAIDVAYLRDPLHILMHPDYPPLLPCLYAWGTLVAGRFAWGAALLLAPLALALAVLVFYGFAQPALGRRLAGEYTAVLASLLGFFMVSERVVGDAEPLLLLFEVATLSALVFAGESSAGLAAAAIGLTAAVLTKIEGTVFAGLVVLASVWFLARSRRVKTAMMLGLPPALALTGWLLFCGRHGLLDIYRLAGRPARFLSRLPEVVAEIGRDGFRGARWVPWILLTALLALSGQTQRPNRRTWMALAAAVGFAVFIVYMYLTSPEDPTWFIRFSAARLMLTPLVCGFLAAASIADNSNI